MLALTLDARLDFLEFHGFAHDVEMFQSLLALLPGTCLGIALGWTSGSCYPGSTLTPIGHCLPPAAVLLQLPRPL